jgi:formylglycine-generating enzyme required for sulfatase activity
MVSKVLAYRRHVDAHMSTLLKSDLSAEIAARLRLGLAHEEQHQELLLMDLLHLFSQWPLRPAYDLRWPADEPGRSGRFRRLPGGLVEVGASTADFAFDNEGPRHPVWLQPFEISDRLVTKHEWLAFMATAPPRGPTVASWRSPRPQRLSLRYFPRMGKYLVRMPACGQCRSGAPPRSKTRGFHIRIATNDYNKCQVTSNRYMTLAVAVLRSCRV